MKQLTVLFLKKDGQVLLAMKKRGFGAGKWNGAGGKVERNETIEAAMIREAEEEISITPTKYEKVAEIEFDEIHSQGTREVVMVHAFIATSWSGEPTESEEMAPQWFRFDAIPYEDMWADDIYWLPLILNDKKLRCKFKLSDTNEVANHEVVEVTSLKSSSD